MLRLEMTRPRVLVVDDEPIILELISTRLGLAGYEVFTARDGHQALNRLPEVKPAAMVLDINMPGMDGFAVLRHMTLMGAYQNVAVMVLTARNNAGDVERAISLGARDYLAKPFKDEQLINRVGRLLRKAGRAPPPSSGSKTPQVYL
jgi:two-component system OmpR family response regulator